MTVRILQGDCREVLKTLPDEAVHCIVTSPPYFGLRDYGHCEQIGLEASPTDFIQQMVAVFRESRRVLRSDGTLWLNMGDTYAGAGRGGNSDAITGQGKDKSKIHNMIKSARRDDAPIPRSDIKRPGFKAKDLMMMPARVAIALQEDGWYLRQDIIWSKPNPMPESVTDRCTKAHEYIFLLSKSPQYFYDADAIRTQLASKTFTTFGTEHHAQGNDALGTNKSDNWGRTVKTRKPKLNSVGEIAGSNRRSVWEISTSGFHDAHFATFPPELPELCIKAGSHQGGVVLDPFGGAGTVGLVADRLQRDAILIELNPEYAAMADRRIRGDAPLFAEVGA